MMLRTKSSTSTPSNNYKKPTRSLSNTIRHLYNSPNKSPPRTNNKSTLDLSPKKHLPFQEVIWLSVIQKTLVRSGSDLKIKGPLNIDVNSSTGLSPKTSKLERLEERIKELEHRNTLLAERCEQEKMARIKTLRMCYSDKMKWRREKFLLMQLNKKLGRIIEQVYRKIENVKKGQE